eukprot:38633-Eustigmatos_ZCMA.PRE.1
MRRYVQSHLAPPPASSGNALSTVGPKSAADSAAYADRVVGHVDTVKFQPLEHALSEKLCTPLAFLRVVQDRVQLNTTGSVTQH